MTGPRALVDRLAWRLIAIGALGGAMLIAILAIDFGFRGKLVTRQWVELLELEIVVLAMIFLIFASAVVATRRTVLQALAPLHAGVMRIEETSESGRRFRLNLADFPLELIGDVTAINNHFKRLEEIAKKRAIFAAEAAHELKTPMAILLLELEALGTDDAKRLKGDVQRMGRLIEQLLVMARLDAHATVLGKAPIINLVEMASELVQSIAPAAIEQGRHVALTVNAPCPTHGRDELVAAAIRNLIENALRVTPRRGVVMVTVGPGARVAVRDGGPGVSKRDLKRLSKPFVRDGNPSSTGAGLGLAIVAQVVDLHHGKLITDPGQSEIILAFPAHHPKSGKF